MDNRVASEMDLLTCEHSETIAKTSEICLAAFNACMRSGE